MQINRLFEIVYLLLNQKKMTASQLAERFEVSSRTIYRDIETLSAAGIPIFMSKGKGGGISLLPEFVLNKTVLTKGEKMDILSSLYAVQAVDFGGVKTALEKMSSLLGGSQSDWIEVDFSSWGNENWEMETFNLIKGAIFENRILQFYYVNGNGDRLERRIYPAKLCFKGQSWYVYGYCTLREDYRFFKLRRIRELLVLDETYLPKLPVGKVLTEKSVFQEDYYQLKLLFSAELAYRIYDEFREYTQLADGSFIVKMIYPKGEWFFGYIMSFGEHCEILEPAEAKEYIQKKLERVSRKYV